MLQTAPRLSVHYVWECFCQKNPDGYILPLMQQEGPFLHSHDAIGTELFHFGVRFFFSVGGTAVPDFR